ncbi:MAG: YDG domain-containing protein [Lachnospiraceae bacterium]|nr:YDG domain-containing protein [Lachnospiraceae bacterium]
MKNKKVRTMGICLSVAMVANTTSPMAVMAQTSEKSTPSVTIKVDHSRSVLLKAEEPTVATSKVYDGTVNAEILDLGQISGIKDGDDVSVEAVAEYENKDAGSDKTIIITYNLTGEDADKYIAPDSISIAECEILPKPLQVVNAKASDKTYDGTVSVQPDQTSLGALNEKEIIEGDDVALDTSKVVMTVSNPDAAKKKPVTAEGYALTGEDIGNYELLDPKVTVTIYPIEYDAAVLEQIKWNQVEFEYNGSEQKPEILADTLPSGVSVKDYNYSEDCVNPGTEKTVSATLSCDSKNVTLTNSSISTQWSIVPCQPTVEIDYINETVTITYPENYQDIPGVQAGVSYTAEKEVKNDGASSVLQLTDWDLPPAADAKNVTVKGMLFNEQSEVFYADEISIPSRPVLEESAAETAAAQIAGSWTATTDSLTCDEWTSSDLEMRLVFADGSTSDWKDDASFSDLKAGTHIESVQFRSKAIEGKQFASVLQTEAVDLYVLQESTISMKSEFGKVYDGEPASVENDFYTYNGDGEVAVTWYDLDGNLLEEAPTEVGTYHIILSVAQTAQYTATSTEPMTYTISKMQAPGILWPTAEGITYGQSLADSALSSEDAAGSFAWKDSSILPSVSDSGKTSYTVVYTPNDTDHYDYSNVTLERGITVSVQKALATIDTSAVALAYTYNGEAQAVNSGAVLNHSEAELSYSIEAVTEPGSYTLTVSAPETDNYLAASADVEITVAKAVAPEILWPTAGEITYGQSLADSVLSSEDTFGSFSWQDDSIIPAVADSGITEYTVVYTPNDTEHYDYSDVALENNITVSVQKALANIDTSAIALTYTYSWEAQAVNSGAVLNHNEAELSYSIEAVTEPGSYILTISAPETDNYLAVSTDLELTVEKVPAPEIIWPTASALTYGQALADSTLSSEDAAGSFAWQDGSITPSVADSDTTEYIVIYTPNDTDHYDYSNVTLEHTVTVSVEKAAASIDTTGISLSYIYDGEAHAVNSGAVLNHSEAELSYSIDAVTEPGTYTLTVSVPETDNYLAASADVEITVEKALAPEVLLPTASSITYGQSLADSVLSSEDTFGSFSWQDDSIIPAVADSDTTEYAVDYTPNDTEHYDYSDVDLEYGITVSVEKAAASIDTTGISLSYIYDGEAHAVNSGAVLNHDESELIYSLDSVTDAGTYTVSIYSQETDNYVAASADVEITVEKAAAPEIVWPTASDITYGQALSESILTGGITEYGTFAWAEEVELPSAGTASYEVIFTPFDTANYDWSQSEYRSEVAVNIAKKPVSVTVPSFEKTYGDADPDFTATAEGILEGDVLAYELSRTPGENAGTYEISATTGEHSNYEISVQTGTLTISPKPLITLGITSSYITGFDQETQNQTVTVTMLDGSTPLTEGTDYTLNYDANSASVTVSGIGNYCGEQKYNGFILNRSNELCSFDTAILLDEAANQKTLSIKTFSNRSQTGEEVLDSYGNPVYSQRNLSLSREFLDSLAAQSITQISLQVEEAILMIPLDSLTADSYLVRLAPMEYEDMTWREFMILDEYVELSDSYRFRITTPLSAEEAEKLASEGAEVPTEKDVTSQIAGLSARIEKSESEKAAQAEGSQFAERKVLLVLRESESYDAARVELAVTDLQDSYQMQLPASGMICLVQDRPENQY